MGVQAMMRGLKALLSLSALLVMFAAPVGAIDNPDLLPDHPTPVIDLAKALSQTQRQSLETSLDAFQPVLLQFPQFAFLRLAASSLTPFSTAALGYASPLERTGLTSVASTPSCAPFQRGRLSASTSSFLASVTSEFKLNSRSKVFCCTLAPASLHTLAQALSSGTALRASLPTVAQAERWSP